MKVAKVSMPPGDRMLRIGLGQNKGRWFFRVDLWFLGYRFTAQPKTFLWILCYTPFYSTNGVCGMRKRLIIPALGLALGFTYSLAAPAMAQSTDAAKAGSAFSQAGDSIAAGFTNGYHAAAKETTHVVNKTGEYAENAGTKTKRFFTDKPEEKHHHKHHCHCNDDNKKSEKK